MRTKTRLTLWLGIVTLLVLVLAVFGLGTIWELRRESRDVLRANYNSIEYAQDMMRALDEHMDTTASMRAFGEGLEKQRANVTEPGEQALTDRLRTTFTLFRAESEEQGARRELRSHLYELIDMNRNAIVLKSKAAEVRADNALMWISLVGTVCFLIAFTLFFSLPERIAEPIRKLTEGIDRIAEGHYRERVELEGGGEFAHMAERFNAMATELERWQNSNLATIMEEKARAEAVINSLEDASIGLDEQGRILFVNRQALDLLGLTAADTTGELAAGIAERNDLLRHVLDDRSGAPMKIVMDGKEQYFASASSTITGTNGPIGSMISLHNITPFQERDQAKTHFLATISHELKTPLASTDIGIGLLERSSSIGDEHRAILSDLRKDHQRLVRIVSELLNLAQAESGKLVVRHEPFRISTALEEAIMAVRAASEQKGICIQHEGVTELPAVLGDAEKCVWVLVNLLGNAIRYAPVGSAVEVVGAILLDTVRIIVQDSGPGIAEELRPMLFERFIHGHARTEPHAGLGLAICREFMNAMGGSITYQQEDALGASFQLTFLEAPIAEA